MNSRPWLFMDSTITMNDLHVLQQLLSMEHTLWVGVTFVVKIQKMMMSILQLLAKAKPPMYVA